MRVSEMDMASKRRRERQPLRKEYTCKGEDMTEVGLKEDNKTNRAAWRKKLITYSGNPRQARDEEEEVKVKYEKKTSH